MLLLLLQSYQVVVVGSWYQQRRIHQQDWAGVGRSEVRKTTEQGGGGRCLQRIWQEQGSWSASVSMINVCLKDDKLSYGEFCSMMNKRRLSSEAHSRRGSSDVSTTPAQDGKKYQVSSSARSWFCSLECVSCAFLSDTKIISAFLGQFMSILHFVNKSY